MISEIQRALVCVSNMERSLPFYRDLLGMKVIMDIEQPIEAVNTSAEALNILTGRSGTRARTVILQKDGVEKGMVELVEFLSPERETKPIAPETKVGSIAAIFLLAFEVNDVDKAYNDLREKGVNFIFPPQVVTAPPLGSVKLAVFRDPDGVMLEICQMLG